MNATRRMAWLDLPRRIPLAVRVALVVSPAILGAQFLTMRLMRETRPIVGIYGGPAPFEHAAAASPNMKAPPPLDAALGHGAPLVVPPPGARVQFMELPDGKVRALSDDELRRFEGHRGPNHLFRAGFRADPPGPPWQSLSVVFAVTTLLVWLSARWVTQPLARLAKAAESLGRDVDQPPLDEDGPPEVRRAAQAFNSMQDRLRRFLRGRADALLAMSHDLKTPITRLQLRLELLPDEQRAGLAQDVDLLQSRVEHALGFMRGVHRDEPMRSVALDALVATIAERLQDTGATVEWSGRVSPLICRPAQLERAIANLMENAVRYGGGAQVEIGEHAASGICIVVRDNGPGVPEELLRRLTEPFFRVEASRSRESGGAGLGLAIVKDIVEAHGGSLKLANRSGGGLEARLTLPRR